MEGSGCALKSSNSTKHSISKLLLRERLAASAPLSERGHSRFQPCEKKCGQKADGRAHPTHAKTAPPRRTKSAGRPEPLGECLKLHLCTFSFSPQHPTKTTDKVILEATTSQSSLSGPKCPSMATKRQAAKQRTHLPPRGSEIGRDQGG